MMHILYNYSNCYTTTEILKESSGFIKYMYGFLLEILFNIKGQGIQLQFDCTRFHD